MKAWIHHKTGPVSLLTQADIEKPKPGPGELLIRNWAIGLNPVDWKIIEWGHPDWTWPHVPGVDGAGEVAAVGPGCGHLIPGMRVAYHQDLLRDGSFAEFTVIPAHAAIPLPEGLSFEAAAALPCPALTAVQALEKVNLPPGSRVLVTGASGAVGGALIQLARPRGWAIHAIASVDSHARVRALGAATARDYKRAGWIDDLADLAAASPFRAVFDMVSGAHAQTLARLIGVNGHLVCIQDRQEKPPFAPFTTNLSLHEVGLNAMHRNAHDRLAWGALTKAGAEIAKATLEGSFDPQLIEVSRFDDLPGALQRLRDGPNPGNRVVSLS
ncbi:alcohol dehydrogenase catalytic domain-containing protein [Ensifer sp. YR511]|uniref:alcohol dehydrogenase catalytic domain-containing protein n=1 Tax=Ensifer sp. YR511 TaxID=1855294 RepID=UPI000890E270|nr:alcohol dehydrogenase catalytic domain-containing protein [Ensifer sp. YR511]SDN03636.1 NADPH:quinone reductase [Ensifer sp. YR511]